jgi:hypothetical protein
MIELANDGRWHSFRSGEEVAAIVDGRPILALCGRVIVSDGDTHVVFRSSPRGAAQNRERCPDCETVLAALRRRGTQVVESTPAARF